MKELRHACVLILNQKLKFSLFGRVTSVTSSCIHEGFLIERERGGERTRRQAGSRFPLSAGPHCLRRRGAVPDEQRHFSRPHNIGHPRLSPCLASPAFCPVCVFRSLLPLFCSSTIRVASTVCMHACRLFVVTRRVLYAHGGTACLPRREGGGR